MKPPNKNFILESLLQQNFFPMQKDSKEEMPPIFTSESFTTDVAHELSNIRARPAGYEQVEYNMTRFHNVPRVLAIPHPKPYAQLAISLSKHWEKIQYICQNENSVIVPRAHSDGRLIIMDYEHSWVKCDRKIKLSSAKKFVVHADITNCFPSIYSHAIPWALVGHKIAKDKKNSKNEWFNEIDRCTQATKRCETQGLAIGPATSNVLSEIILAKVDEVLAPEFSYIRFIDDYTCYCKTYEEAENFIQSLSKELKNYGLALNIKKTSISKLPIPINSSWVTSLNARRPLGDIINWSQIVTYLDFALELQESFKDGSVIKYAVKSIRRSVNPNCKKYFLRYILNLCQHYPVLIPTINDTLDEANSIDPCFDCNAMLVFLISDSISNQRSDSITWLLYYLIKQGSNIEKELALRIIEGGDCVPILMLSQMTLYDSLVVKFCNGIKKSDPYEIDKYWLLLYQLFYSGKIPNPYVTQEDQKVFNKLKARDISFLKSESKAQSYIAKPAEEEVAVGNVVEVV